MAKNVSECLKWALNMLASALKFRDVTDADLCVTPPSGSQAPNLCPPNMGVLVPAEQTGMQTWHLAWRSSGRISRSS